MDGSGCRLGGAGGSTGHWGRDPSGPGGGIIVITDVSAVPDTVLRGSEGISPMETRAPVASFDDATMPLGGRPASRPGRRAVVRSCVWKVPLPSAPPPTPYVGLRSAAAEAR
jgi:hypothetical protein